MSNEQPWVFLDREYEGPAAAFQALIQDIQAGRIGMEVYNELRDAGKVPAVNVMAFNKGVDVFGTGMRYANAHNGASWTLGGENGEDAWRGWQEMDWLPPVPPPRENLPDAA